MSVFNVETREEFIKEVFPDGVPKTLASRDLLHESPMDWTVSRKRLLEAGIRQADEKQVTMVLHEYASVVGIDNAIRVYFEIWGNMVERMMDEDNDENDDENRDLD